MPDWTRSMKQTFEYSIVDPATWRDKERIDNIESCAITRDLESDTLGSASLTSFDDYSDKYIRCRLVTEQDGRIEKTVLGTHLYQSPSTSYRARRQSSSQDGYTSLIELTEKMPSYGYSLAKSTDIMGMAASIIEEQARAPVVRADSSDQLFDIFVSNTDDTWLTFLTDLIGNANYDFALDPMGQILFAKRQNINGLNPVWTYNDDNSSILYPDISIARDLYGVPNVVEVIYSSPERITPLIATAENTDPASPVSIPNRGRRVVVRETSPNIVEGAKKEQIEEYAKNRLKELSSLEYTITYKHGYCPVQLGDCVMLNYKLGNLSGVKAKVIRQVISCESGCSVEETAVYSKQLWG